MLNRHWTFRAGDLAHATAGTRFAVVQACAIPVERRPALPVRARPRASTKIPAQAILTVPVLAVTFFVNRVWSFARPGEPGEPPPTALVSVHRRRATARAERRWWLALAAVTVVAAVLRLIVLSTVPDNLFYDARRALDDALAAQLLLRRLRPQRGDRRSTSRRSTCGCRSSSVKLFG